MNTIINFKTDKKVKADAQKIAQKMGLNLSDVLNISLRTFVREKKLNIAIEEPSDYLLKQLAQAEKERVAGLVSPSFNDAKSAIAWLNDKKVKYAIDLSPKKYFKKNRSK